jgi:NADH:ubiquinone oxidoreductase subunit 6 (subunit J)
MLENYLILQIVVMGALLVLFLCAVIAQDLLYSVISLATGSVILGGIFFLDASPFAGVVEISVGAGLVTALLITALSLTRGEGDESRQ